MTAKPIPIVRLDGRFEGHQVEYAHVPDLKAGQDQQYESQCIYPVPDAYR